MRNLAVRQKKLISAFIQSQLNPKESWERIQSPFKGFKNSLDHTDIPEGIMGKIEDINMSEILYQEIDRFMNDECTNIIHAQIYK